MEVILNRERCFDNPRARRYGWWLLVLSLTPLTLFIYFSVEYFPRMNWVDTYGTIIEIDNQKENHPKLTIEYEVENEGEFSQTMFWEFAHTDEFSIGDSYRLRYNPNNSSDAKPYGEVVQSRNAVISCGVLSLTFILALILIFGESCCCLESQINDLPQGE